MKQFILNIKAELKRRWLAETPKIVVFLQVLSGLISAIPTYYSDLPYRFQKSVPESVTLYITVAGITVTLILQLITKKQPQ